MNFKPGDKVKCLADWVPNFYANDIHTVEYIEDTYVHLVGVRGDYFPSRFIKFTPHSIYDELKQILESA